MSYARIYPWRTTRRSRAPSNGPEAYFVAQLSAGYTTNMFGFDLRQGQAKIRSISLSERPLTSASAPEVRTSRRLRVFARPGGTQTSRGVGARSSRVPSISSRIAHWSQCPARRAPARLSATPPRLMQRPCAMASRPRPDLPSSGSFHSTPQRPAAVQPIPAPGARLRCSSARR